jgi:cyclopropane-fatty-acyl-phospholipid synthase
MNSLIYCGDMGHARLSPVTHRFRLPVYLYALDLDELPELDRTIPGFGYNRFRPASLYDRDYLDKGPGTIREKLLRHLRENQCHQEIGQVILVTNLAYFRHVFNPVSFYYCFSPSGPLAAVVAEVNNTVGERHLYVLHEPQSVPANGYLARYRFPKEFHVSPFNRIEGEYEGVFADIRQRLEIQINLSKDGRPILDAWVTGTAQPLTAANHAALLRRYPLRPWLTIPRILTQAARLYFDKKLPFYHKPFARSPHTLIQAPLSAFERFCMNRVTALFRRFKTGTLTLSLPDKEETFGQPDGNPAARITVLNPRFFTRSVLDGDIGFGESFSCGDWDTPDVTSVIRLFIENREAVTERGLAPALASWALNRWQHLRRDNTQEGSRKNIHEHYDLGNDFFRRFLDASMSYSCGIYRSPADTLEEAQANKLDTLIEMARIEPHHHVLEIGCGWGSFALRAARQVGCRVTAVTISREQYEWTMDLVRHAGLDTQVAVILEDYRNLSGQFDRIVSIEMLEAVGHRHLGTFFRTCDRCLIPNGLVALQVITIPDQRYDQYRNTCDWIQKHIFPGGLLPSLSALNEAMKQDSEFLVEHLDNIGVHYARTLADWRERFLADPVIRKALADGSEFHRKWLYYFGYCEAAFASRTVEDLQLILTRPGNPSLPQPPYRPGS